MSSECEKLTFGCSIVFLGRLPHEWPEYVSGYYIIKLNSYTQVNCQSFWKFVRLI